MPSPTSVPATRPTTTPTRNPGKTPAPSKPDRNPFKRPKITPGEEPKPKAVTIKEQAITAVSGMIAGKPKLTVNESTMSAVDLLLEASVCIKDFGDYHDIPAYGEKHKLKSHELGGFFPKRGSVLRYYGVFYADKAPPREEILKVLTSRVEPVDSDGAKIKISYPRA